MMTQIIIKLKRLLNEKGQGIVEFGLLCAFCAAISIAARDVGFADAFRDSLDKSRPELLSAAIAQNSEGTYLYYFADKGWRSYTKQQLSAISNDERKKADQLFLIKLAETYIGKTETGILNLMNYYSNSWQQNVEPEFIEKLACSNQETGTGFSGRLYPLELNWDNLNDANPEKRWISFSKNNNQNTVNYLTGGQATLYDKYDPKNPTFNEGTKRTLTTDRLLYSESMLNTKNVGGNDNNVITISVKLHYTDGKVDRVAIAARNGKWNGTIGEDLCLMVTETGHSVVQKKGSNDILLEDKNPGIYADVWNVPDVQ